MYKNQSFLSSEFVPSPPKAKRQRYKAVCEKVFFTRLPVKEPYSETGQELGLTGSTGKKYRHSSQSSVPVIIQKKSVPSKVYLTSWVGAQQFSSNCFKSLPVFP